MYFPFLRGKQNELFAILEIADLIKQSKKVIPIIEPMNMNRTTKKALPELNEREVPYILIVNPLNGDLVEEGLDVFSTLLQDLKNKDLLNLGYFITENTTINEIRSVIKLFPEFSLSFIHCVNSTIKNDLSKIKDRISFHCFVDGTVSSSYQMFFSDHKRVLIKDSYNAKSRNVDYPDDEYFSDLFSTYRQQNYFGFGDYQMIGSKISGGGPAHAVALHLSYLKEKNGKEIWMRHFISDDTESPANVQGKYFQALAKLVNFLDGYDNTPETIGSLQYRENFSDEVYRGLGYPKRLSIKHHIELMTQLL